MIMIRTDANNQIAMGHLMRCMSIGLQLSALGEEVLFVLSEPDAVEQVKQKGFACVCLHNHYNEKEQETEALLHFVKEKQCELLFLDSYEVTLPYMKALKAQTRLAYLDDLNLFCYPADLIVNYTFGTTRELYAERGYEETQEFLLGSRYVPLRPEFAAGRIAIRPKVQDILVTTGGTDEQDILCGMAECLKKYPLVQKHLVAGRFYHKPEALKALEQEDVTVHVYHNVSDMAGLMRRCDLAVSAGGTTLAELAACGIPTVCFSVAENQVAGTQAYAAAGMLRYAGDVRNGRLQLLDRISSEVERLYGQPTQREQLGETAYSQVDGKGAERIARRLVTLQNGG
ncbi:MAG: UDP-2,4-diacetamido-2,4,6-trideoxy-beta-L-altropyranose hydrolase [Lachnospiraceae bacterium]|nr:UDP-2,4-diacetamido-2,4,6-trideoxy-beta-L-altropyranose hydrolase [Lachnospiraceae bacterium]